MPDNKPDIKTLSLNITTVIQIIIFIAGLLGVYYTMKSKVDFMQEKVQKIETIIEQNNLELINFKLDRLQQSVDKLIDDK